MKVSTTDHLDRRLIIEPFLSGLGEIYELTPYLVAVYLDEKMQSKSCSDAFAGLLLCTDKTLPRKSSEILFWRI